MVDPVFKAPPPPPMEQPETPAVPESNSTQENVPAPEVAETQVNPVAEVAEEQVVPQKQGVMERINALKDHMVHYFWYSMMGLFLLGAFFGCAMSPGSGPAPQQTTAVSGISKRVVTNGDRKVPLKICGTDSASKSCLFYVQNNKIYDVQAEDFFEEVGHKTQRNPFNIGLDNPLYRRQIIKPGYFAEIIVPAT